MLKMAPDTAMKQSLELAKVLCSANGEAITIDKDGANELADFIEVLQNRFTGHSE